MPIYVYETLPEDGPIERFEFFQKMSDEPFTHHPETGQPIRRVPASVSVGGKGGGASPSSTELPSDSKLEKMGFTKYVKTDTGKYEKTAGKQGPDKLDASEP